MSSGLWAISLMRSLCVPFRGHGHPFSSCDSSPAQGGAERGVGGAGMSRALTYRPEALGAAFPEREPDSWLSDGLNSEAGSWLRTANTVWPAPHGAFPGSRGNLFRTGVALLVTPGRGERPSAVWVP